MLSKEMQSFWEKFYFCNYLREITDTYSQVHFQKLKEFKNLDQKQFVSLLKEPAFLSQAGSSLLVAAVQPKSTAQR